MAEIKEIVNGATVDYVERSPLARQLLDDVGKIVQASPDDLCAYVVVTVDKNGIPSIVAQDDLNSGPISLRMLAGLAQSCIQEQLIVMPAIRHSLINSGLAAPDPSPA